MGAHGAAVAAVEARLVDGAVLGQVAVGQGAVRRVAVADVHKVPPIAAGLRPPRVQQRPFHHHGGATGSESRVREPGRSALKKRPVRALLSTRLRWD